MEFFALPYWLLMAILVAAAVGAACGLHAIVRRAVPYEKLIEHNDVAGFMIAVVGVLYAVLISFVVVVVWQQYTDSDLNYGSEVASVADIGAFARSLPPDRTRLVQSLIARYVDEMVDDEWPAMRSAGASTSATATLAKMARAIDGVRPNTTVQSDARTHLQGAVERLFDLRNRRLEDNSHTLPPVLWTALFVGAFITVGFGFLFGVVNFRIQLIMTGAVAALIAVMFTLLIELDFPFRRDTAISAGRWLELQRYLGFTRAPAPHGGRGDGVRAGR